MSVLSLIQEAIDVRLMDVKNISNLIYDYIEYEEVQGPQYDVYIKLFDDRRIYIHEAKFLAVKPEMVWKTIDERGIIINGKPFTILGDGYDMFVECVIEERDILKQFNLKEYPIKYYLVRRVNEYETRTQEKNIPVKNFNNKSFKALIDVELLGFFNLWKFHLKV